MAEVSDRKREGRAKRGSAQIWKPSWCKFRSGSGGGESATHGLAGQRCGKNQRNEDVFFNKSTRSAWGMEEKGAGIRRHQLHHLEAGLKNDTKYHDEEGRSPRCGGKGIYSNLSNETQLNPIP